jgi:hypothetical protein
VIQVNPRLSARLLEFLAALLQRGILFVVLRPEDDDLASRNPLFFRSLGLFGGFAAEGEGAAGPHLRALGDCLGDDPLDMAACFSLAIGPTLPSRQKGVAIRGPWPFPRGL